MNQYKSEKEVRNCTKRYLLYFAFTTIKRKQIYGEKYDDTSVFTTYDVYSSDSIEEIREQRDILLSLVSNLNSYYLYIVDKLELKILKVIKKFSKVEDICDYFKINSSYERSRVKTKIGANYGNGSSIIPVIPFKFKNKLQELDFFFRGPSEIPPDYKWDIGEYEGWLQFRWGDGKNAIQK